MLANLLHLVWTSSRSQARQCRWRHSSLSKNEQPRSDPRVMLSISPKVNVTRLGNVWHVVICSICLHVYRAVHRHVADSLNWHQPLQMCLVCLCSKSYDWHEVVGNPYCGIRSLRSGPQYTQRWILVFRCWSLWYFSVKQTADLICVSIGRRINRLNGSLKDAWHCHKGSEAASSTILTDGT